MYISEVGVHVGVPAPPPLDWQAGSMALHITGDAAADELLTDNPLALLIGMLLDQRFA